MTERLYSWVRVSDSVWEHEPSGTKLRRDSDGWSVRFPSTTAVPFSRYDAEAMWRAMSYISDRSFTLPPRREWRSSVPSDRCRSV